MPAKQCIRGPVWLRGEMMLKYVRVCVGQRSLLTRDAVRLVAPVSARCSRLLSWQSGVRVFGLGIFHMTLPAAGIEPTFPPGMRAQRR